MAGVTEGQDTREATGPSGQGSNGDARQRHQEPASTRLGTWSEAQRGRRQDVAFSPACSGAS